MTSEYKEQGTKISGYADGGPYSCRVCVHKKDENSNICIHPTVINDPELSSKRVSNGVRINLAHGCCRFVRVPEHPLNALKE